MINKRASVNSITYTGAKIKAKVHNKNSGKTKDGKVKGDMIISEDGGMFKFREIQ